MGTDTHIIMMPSPGGPVPTPTPMPFSGLINGELSPDVIIENQPAAVRGSTADNMPPHIPAGGPFQKSPSNKATIQMGSMKVLINKKEAACAGNIANTCNDPVDMPVGQVIATGTVLIGD
jgi:uncharacterized Zn-binding protein involved in type VI secretion